MELIKRVMQNVVHNWLKRQSILMLQLWESLRELNNILQDPFINQRFSTCYTINKILFVLFYTFFADFFFIKNKIVLQSKVIKCLK